MILVDTSIWIEFFRGNQAYFEVLRRLLERTEVIGLECIFGELLQGAASKEERDLLEEFWHDLPKLDEKGLWIKAGKMSSERKFFSKGIGLIDTVIISAAKKSGAQIWTLDKKLKSALDVSGCFNPAGVENKKG